MSAIKLKVVVCHILLSGEKVPISRINQPTKDEHLLRLYCNIVAMVNIAYRLPGGGKLLKMYIPISKTENIGQCNDILEDSVLVRLYSVEAFISE